MMYIQIKRKLCVCVIKCVYKFIPQSIYNHNLQVVKLRIILKNSALHMFPDLFLAVCMIVFLQKGKKSNTNYVIKQIKRNTDRMSLSISLLQIKADDLRHHREELFFLLILFLDNQSKHYLILDLLVLHLNKMEPCAAYSCKEMKPQTS